MNETYQDPVCGMQVTPATAAGKSEYKGNAYYFSFTEYQQAFEQNPEKYLRHEEKSFS